MSPGDAFAIGFWGYLGYVVSGVVMVAGVFLLIFMGLLINLVWSHYKRKRKVAP